MTALEFRLLNEFQRTFPLVPEPYAVLAETLGVERTRGARWTGAAPRVREP